MRKSRMISIIAASMLTATVVFTGCGGGGGSSSNLVSSSSSLTSSSSSTSSSVPQITIKKIKVSDGYVLAATVKCKDTQGQDVAGPGVATENPGEYELSLTSECPVLCAKDGYIDINGNNQVDLGEPKAPKMTAPGTFNNINPYTTLIQSGVAPEKLAEAFNLPVDTNFDIPIPESEDVAFKKAAYKLSATLAYLEKSGVRGLTLRDNAFPSINSYSNSSSSISSINSSSSSNTCLPGEPCNDTLSSQASSSSAEAEDTMTLADLVAALNSGKKFNDLTFPEYLVSIFAAIDSAENPEELLGDFLGKYIGEYESMSQSSTTTSTASSESGTTVECNEDSAFPCEVKSSYASTSSSSSIPSGYDHSVPVYSSSETVSSSSLSEASSSSSDDNPPPPPGDNASSSSSDDNPPPPPGDNASSSSSSSSEASSSSSDDNPPPPPGA